MNLCADCGLHHWPLRQVHGRCRVCGVCCGKAGRCVRCSNAEHSPRGPSNRALWAADMRRAGRTLAEIGKLLGVSASRAAQLSRSGGWTP